MLTYSAIFDRALGLNPEGVAVDAHDARLTYRELDARAEALAQLLVARGIGGAERVVGICVPRSAAMIVALVAIVRTGAAYLPLDVAHPRPRLRYLLEDSRPQAIVVTDETAGRFPAGQNLVDMGDVIAAPGASARSRVPSSAAAYIIYTSGTTGRPKATVVSHSGLEALARSQAESWRLTTRSRVLQTASLSFDASVKDIIGTWWAAATLVLPGPNRLSGQALADQMANWGITHALVPPPVLTGASASGADSLECLFVGAEACPPALVREWARNGRRMVNTYGPTEATVTCLHSHDLDPTRDRVPIGHPIEGMRAYVLDETLTPATDGELYVAGAGLARGYAGQHGLTACRFVADPLVPGERMYRTGDRVSIDETGEIHYLGRTDDQIKIRGFRVEPGEIEATALGLPGIKEAVVTTGGGPQSDKLLLHVAPLPGATVDPRALRSALARELPDHMVPASVTVLPALPLTVSGKVDRSALPEPVWLRAAGEPPRTTAERIVAEAVEQVTGIGDLTVEDSLVDLGCHSLDVARIVAELRSRTGLCPAIADVLASPRIGDVAALLDDVGPTSAAPVPVPRTGRMACSPSQERMWLAEESADGSSGYVVPAAVRLGRGLDVAALERAWLDVVERHEILRTRYGSDGERVWQRVDAPDPVRDGIRVREIGPGEVEEAVASAVHDRFDLAEEVVRPILLRTPSDHVFVLVVHHIACDGWSMMLLDRDLDAAYAARSRGSAPPWQPLPLQFADVAAQQVRRAADPVATTEQIAFWRDRLRDVTAGCPQTPAVEDGHGRAGYVAFDIDTRVHQAVLALAQRLRTTPFVVLHAAMAVVLAGLGAGRRFSMGAAVGARDEAGLADMVGPLVNTIVLVSEVDPGGTFTELVTQLRESDLTAMRNFGLGFDRVVEALNPSREPGRTPWIDVLISMGAGERGFVPDYASHGASGATLELPHLPGVRQQPTPAPAARFQLVWALTERFRAGNPDGIAGALEYAAEVGAENAERLVRRLESVLRQVATRPDAPLAGTDFLLPGEAVDMVGPASVGGATIASLWNAQVENDPQAVALIAGQERWTRVELDERARRWAALLRSRGVAIQDVVACALPRGVDQVAAFLGVSLLGAVWQPIDRRYPDERQRMVVEDTSAAIVITLAADAARWDGQRLVVADDPGIAELLTTIAPVPDCPGATLPPDTGAYIIHTSGSTGRPKGVYVTHTGIADLVASERRWCGVGKGAVVAQAASPGFDASVFELTMGLLTGAAGALITDEHRDSGGALVAEWVRLGVTHAFMVGSFALTLDPSSIPEGMTLVLGGEAFPAQFATALAGRTPLVNLYGPTEATIFGTGHRLRGPHGVSVPIGKPVYGARLEVLDTTLRPVAPGVVGELYISGPGLARGYVGEPGLTASRFVAGPDGGRRYRTGDLVRLDAEGRLHFVGRNDEQVKLRGFRIEPGEVEAVLGAAPAVTGAAVSKRDDLAGGRALVAHVAGAGVDVERIRAHAAALLPAHAVPSHWVVLDRLPVTIHGKLDRGALPAPSLSGSGKAAEDGEQAEACRIMGEVIGVSRVGPDDDFFRLGGHSLLVVKLVSRLAAAGIRVAMRDVLLAPTVRGFLTRARGGAPATGITQAPRPADGVVPMSGAQRRLWLIEQIDGPSPVYNIPVVVDADDIDLPALQAALGDVVARHEPLRSVVMPGVEPAQRIIPASEAVALVPAIDEICTPDAAAAIDAAARHVFRLTEELPVRVSVIRSGNGCSVVVVLHHIAADGWSMEPLLRDLESAYVARSEGRDPRLSQPALQYHDWARAAATTDPALLAERTTWWEHRLGSLPEEVTFPPDRARGKASGRGAGQVRTEIDAATQRGLTTLAGRAGVSSFVVLHGLFAALLNLHGAGDDIVVGTVTAGRDSSALEDVVGFFVNTVVLRSDLSGDPTFEGLLARLKLSDADSLAHADVAFDSVVERLNPDRSGGRHPLFQVMFTLQDHRREAIPGALFDVARARSLVVGSKFDLTLTLEERRDGIGVTADYSRDLFDDETATAILHRYVLLARRVVADPSLRMHELRGHAPGEATLLRSWGTPTKVDPAPAGLETLFVDALRVAGEDALAVEAPDGRLTYGELDRRSSRMAAWLRTRGVGPGHRVGVCVPRSADTIVALLAVARAQAVLVPLDATHPAARLRRLVEDCDMRVVLAGGGGIEALERAGTRTPVLDLADADGDSCLPEAAPRGGDVAYIIHTSGSTGEPKGVEVLKRGLGAFARAQEERYGLAPGTRVLQLASLAFDASILELCLAWPAGGTLVVPPPGVLVGDELAQWLSRCDVSLVTPGALATVDPAGVDGLGTLLVGAEACSAELVARFAPGRSMFNAYGPTEATVAATVSGPLDTGRGAPPIGRPLAGARLLVLDSLLRPVPIGVDGELYIGGPGVALGYRDRAGLTATRFVADPDGGGERVYRTGDVVRWNRSGELLYRGRSDDQVKLRGFRVEPGEIASVLRAVEGVEQVHVMVCEDRPGQPALVVYVTPAGISTGAVLERARAELPPHAVPSHVIALAALPLTTNGKLDLKALPEPGSRTPGDDVVAPLTDVERTICEAYETVLRCPGVGRMTDFFAIGGHSLAAARVVAAVATAGWSVSVRDLFEAPTPAGLASRAVAAAAPRRPRPRLTPRSRV